MWRLLARLTLQGISGVGLQKSVLLLEELGVTAEPLEPKTYPLCGTAETIVHFFSEGLCLVPLFCMVGCLFRREDKVFSLRTFVFGFNYYMVIILYKVPITKLCSEPDKNGCVPEKEEDG